MEKELKLYKEIAQYTFEEFCNNFDIKFEETRHSKNKSILMLIYVNGFKFYCPYVVPYIKGDWIRFEEKRKGKLLEKTHTSHKLYFYNGVINNVVEKGILVPKKVFEFYAKNKIWFFKSYLQYYSEKLKHELKTLKI